MVTNITIAALLAMSLYRVLSLHLLRFAHNNYVCFMVLTFCRSYHQCIYHDVGAIHVIL